MEIKVRLERDEDGYWVATCPSLPGCISQGKTQKGALKNIKEAIKLHVSSLAEDSMPIFGAHKAKETVVEVTV
jgi:predicted RNase H-like HicB family nuclease